MEFIKQDDEDTWLRDSVEFQDKKPDLSLIKFEVKAESAGAEYETSTEKQEKDMITPSKIGCTLNPDRNKEGESNSRGKKSNRSVWQEAMENAPISDEVANLCRYKCLQCDIKYETKCNLYGHFSRNIYKQHRPKGHLSDCATKIIVHKCRICSTLVLCEKSMILDHLRNVHKIRTLDSYPTLDETKSIEKEETQNKKLTWKERFEMAPVSEKIKNLCIFKCLVCSRKYSLKASLKFHL